METNNNLEWYNYLAAVPLNAQKVIGAGKLKGKTDINPMWRLKMLTMLFGKPGFGWYIDNVTHWVERDGNESAAWVELNLFVKDPHTGEWSKPIHGIGGSKQFGKGQGDGINDEAFKMAYTDAISVACKALGMAADVYWSDDVTRYALMKQPVQQPVQQPIMQPAPKTLEDVIKEVEAAQSGDAIIGIWNANKAQFGDNVAFKKAVAQHPMNPNRANKKK